MIVKLLIDNDDGENIHEFRGYEMFPELEDDIEQIDDINQLKKYIDSLRSKIYKLSDENKKQKEIIEDLQEDNKEIRQRLWQRLYEE